MRQKGTLDSRLKQIRKELSLIDKDLETLSGSASGGTAEGPKPRIRSKELREKHERSSGRATRAPRAEKASNREQLATKKRAKDTAPLPQAGKDEQFLEYLSSSFNSGRPMRQERRIQRNKAILMLIIVLFILFFVMYRMMT